ncbi:DnaJ domain-containing protein [Methylopila sp. Yamaguchi]|uniref:DnaJ domain-containing protein n=1 Tax=Methylopila sp. Yamaguchi TaxID=1437817 RepID=UPI0026BB6AAF
MIWVLVGAMALAALVALGRLFVAADVQRLRKTLRFLAGAAWAIGFAMTLSGKPVLGMTLLGLGAVGLGAVALPGARRRSAASEGDRHRGAAGGSEGAERDADGRRGRGGFRRSGVMTEQEAYQILGLQPGARPEEIVRAHRTLMKKIHPDQGGTTELAARVNAAKDMLMGPRHR